MAMSRHRARQLRRLCVEQPCRSALRVGNAQPPGWQENANLSGARRALTDSTLACAQPLSGAGRRGRIRRSSMTFVSAGLPLALGSPTPPLAGHQLLVFLLQLVAILLLALALGRLARRAGL